MSASNLKKKVQRLCAFVKRCKEHNFWIDDPEATKYGSNNGHEILKDVLNEIYSYADEGNAASAFV